MPHLGTHTHHANSSDPQQNDTTSNQPNNATKGHNPHETSFKHFWATVVEHKRAVIISICAIIFFTLLIKVLEPREDLMKLDGMAWSAIVDGMRMLNLQSFMESMSNLASPLSLIVMLILIIAFAPGKRPGLFCALNLILVCILNVILKDLVQRPRPESIMLIPETGFSFPSGHSMVAMAFFGLLIWLVWKYKRGTAVKWFCCICFALIIVVIGISRIYLGVHFASDVLAGFCISVAWLALYTSVAAPLLLKSPDQVKSTQLREIKHLEDNSH